MTRLARVTQLTRLTRQVPAAARRFSDTADRLVLAAAAESRQAAGDVLRGMENWIRQLTDLCADLAASAEVLCTYY